MVSLSLRDGLLRPFVRLCRLGHHAPGYLVGASFNPSAGRFGLSLDWTIARHLLEGNMPPQPLGAVIKHKIPKLDLTPSSIGERPELAILVAKAVAISAVIETQWARLLAGILEANAPPVIAMYEALSGGNAKRDALEAAATKVLAPDLKEIFDALMMIARPLAKMRNQFVHWGWGVCHDLPDALILQDPQSVIWLHYEVDEYVRKVIGMSTAEAATIEKPKDDLSTILVVRKRDIEEFISRLSRLRGFLAVFTNVAPHVNPVIRGALGANILSTLLGEPEIAEALSRLRQRRRTPPSAPPPPLPP